jgi:hypothetical protein
LTGSISAGFGGGGGGWNAGGGGGVYSGGGGCPNSPCLGAQTFGCKNRQGRAGGSFNLAGLGGAATLYAAAWNASELGPTLRRRMESRQRVRSAALRRRSGPMRHALPFLCLSSISKEDI